MTHSLGRMRVIPPRSRQTGAALFVGLVLLLVMTVLGVSGMNTATLELAMAGNAQAQQQAFQAAETGIDIAISQGAFTTFAPMPPLTITVGEAEADVRTEYRLATGVADGAFSLGVGTGSVQAFHFDVVSTGSGPRGAMSTHTQSFYVVGPGGP